MMDNCPYCNIKMKDGYGCTTMAGTVSINVCKRCAFVEVVNASVVRTTAPVRSDS